MELKFATRIRIVLSLVDQWGNICDLVSSEQYSKHFPSITMHQVLFKELCLYFTCFVLKTILGHKYCYFPHSAEIETGMERLRKLPYTYNIN